MLRFLYHLKESKSKNFFYKTESSFFLLIVKQITFLEMFTYWLKYKLVLIIEHCVCTKENRFNRFVIIYLEVMGVWWFHTIIIIIIVIINGEWWPFSGPLNNIRWQFTRDIWSSSKRTCTKSIQLKNVR